MLKWIFAVLLLANGALLAAQQGLFGQFGSGAREPARLQRQLKAQSIVLQKPAAAPAAASPAPPAPPASPASPASPAPEGKPPVAAAPEVAAACFEVGNFSLAQATRFEARLASLALAQPPQRQEVDGPSSRMVLIPPNGGKAGAELAVAELRRLGISDYFVIQDDTARQWGVSLGLFRSDESAGKRLEAVTRAGVKNARVIEYGAPQSRVVFRLPALERGQQDKLRAILEDFSRQEMRDCA